MPTGTKFNPFHTNELDKTALLFNAQGVTANPTAGTTTNIDLALTDDHLITGAWVVVSGATLGDTISFQVIDSSGVLAPPGTMLNQFMTSWYLPASAETQLDMVYPAKIIAGLTLRVVYTSTGATAPFIGINYKLHKVLV